MMSPDLDQRGYKLPPREVTSSNCNVLFQLYVRKFYNEVMGNDKSGNNDRTTHNNNTASRVGWSSCTAVCLSADSPSAIVTVANEPRTLQKVNAEEIKERNVAELTTFRAQRKSESMIITHAH